MPPVDTLSSPATHIEISIADQTLVLVDSSGQALALYRISTGLNGPGEQNASGCTPRGEHYVRAMIGAGLPLNTVFIARRPTGEVYTPELARAHPSRDWILSRILWLCGREWGRNRGPGVDTFRRFIYIHGTPDTEPMGVARSHGCIRMRNQDVADLFERVAPGTRVLIL